jgi:SAM-dependent methyltransferase
MKKIPQWRVAQKGEKGLWDGVIHDDYFILNYTSIQTGKAPGLMSSLGRTPEKSLEVGIGPFGLGVSAFLPEIPFRLALDPLPPVSLDYSPVSPDSKVHSTYELRACPHPLRAGLRRRDTCSDGNNGSRHMLQRLDHVSDPDAVLREIYRVLKSDGCLYFDVDTFSLCGLVKWHLRTKRAHKDEIVVTTHPYRMLERGLLRRMRAAGFHLRKLGGHTVVSNIVGHARVSSFLGTK